jgi:hypothetical protein
MRARIEQWEAELKRREAAESLASEIRPAADPPASQVRTPELRPSASRGPLTVASVPTPPGSTGAPGSIGPGWYPDLVRDENRLGLAKLVELRQRPGNRGDGLCRI